MYSSRHARLRTRGQYQRVFARPIKVNDDCFTILARGNDIATARLGLAVSRKSAPRAVDRNRVKRVVRESFRRRYPGLPALDLVVLSRKGIADRPNARLFASLERLWNQLQKRCVKS